SAIRCYPVVENGRLVGQLSRRDVLRALEKRWRASRDTEFEAGRRLAIVMSAPPATMVTFALESALFSRYHRRTRWRTRRCPWPTVTVSSGTTENSFRGGMRPPTS